MKIALISDFDGTISKKDFFWYAIDNLLEKSDIEPWQDYKSGKITHFEALRRIFSKIRQDKIEFNNFVLGLPIEECFVEVVNFCNDKQIPFYAVSAGADYYIKLIFDNYNVLDKIKLVTNKSEYSHDQGLKMLCGSKNDPYYSSQFGISKKAVVEKLKSDGYFCIYAGDGTPDFEAAKISDVVFARGTLLELCNEANVKTQNFDSYCQILDYLKGLKN